MIKNNCSFDAERSDCVLILTLHGEIDHHGAVRVRTEMDELIYEERPQKVILDLSEIEFMDSSGLGLIMGRFALLQNLGGVLTLRNPNPRIMKIFELGGLGRMIQLESEEKEEKK